MKCEEYTLITQGLRDLMVEGNQWLFGQTGRGPKTLSCSFLKFTEACNAIDAVHSALEDENASLREQNAKLRETLAEHARSNVEAVTFIDRLSDAVDKRDDLDLWGVRYKALPLGADGSSLGIGDKVDSDVHAGGTVIAVRWDEAPSGIRTLIAVRPDGWDTATWHDPGDFRRHHHIEPTVKDVLREFTRAILNQKPEYREQNIAKFAKRLQLANREPLEEVEE